MNTNHKKEDDQSVDQEPIEDLNQEDRVPEFDEIGTALNGI